MATNARYNIFNAALCSGTASTISSAIPLHGASGDGFSVALAASTSAATIAVTYEVSQDGTNFDTTSTSPSRTIIPALAKNYTAAGFSVPVSKQVRIKCKGNATNPTSVTVTGHLMIDE